MKQFLIKKKKAERGDSQEAGRQASQADRQEGRKEGGREGDNLLKIFFKWVNAI